jgi:hypothetical protein
MTYLEMYLEAAIETLGNYEGYKDANALSLYVNDKFNVNAASDNVAHDALCDAMPKLRELQSFEDLIN